MPEHRKRKNRSLIGAKKNNRRKEGKNEMKITLKDGSVKEYDSALSVYLPARGDGLWETAKKLLQSPEQIQATNPELSFPLTGNERILVYRPKAD